MKSEKNAYETPSVKKVEFDFNVRIAASSCGAPQEEWLGGCILGF
jgi:hypothetical protein